MKSRTQNGRFAGSEGEYGPPPWGRFVDLHCHCLPGLDDGSESLSAAVALCRMMRNDNIACAVATPHQLGRFEGRATASGIRRAVRVLNHQLRNSGIDLRVFPGAEVRVDERIGWLLAEDQILTLGDRKQYLLLELPRDVFIDIEPLLAHLRRSGIEAIIAHPERNAPALRHFRALRQWVEEGASLQITAASLIGWWGSIAQDAAWSLVAAGWAGIIATDAHDEEVNRPCMTQAFHAVAARFGTPLARLLCTVNPSRVLAGEKLIPGLAWDKQEVG